MKDWRRDQESNPAFGALQAPGLPIGRLVAERELALSCEQHQLAVGCDEELAFTPEADIETEIVRRDRVRRVVNGVADDDQSIQLGAEFGLDRGLEISPRLLGVQPAGDLALMDRPEFLEELLVLKCLVGLCGFKGVRRPKTRRPALVKFHDGDRFAFATSGAATPMFMAWK